MKTFQIALFSRFSLTSESRPIPLGDGSARLLAYLALSYGRLVPRSRTAGALWPDLSESRARANLSTALWRLRQALLEQACPADIIQASTDSLRVDSDVCLVDVESFVQSALSPGCRATSLDTLARAVHALDLYKGDLLEDWDVEWCRLEREELRKRYAYTLHALSDGFEQRGRNDLAMLYARRAAQADPLNEAIQRTLMRLLYRTGDKASAVNQFNQFARLAKSELGVEPDRETIALVREIRRPSSLGESSETLKPLVPISIRPERVPLVGRDIERLELNALLDSAVAGKGGGVLLVGEAGIGKSKLADWVMEEWAARGGAAGRGRCIEFNDPVPYQPLLDALGSFVDEGDLSGLSSGDGGPTAHLLYEPVTGTVGRTGTSESLWSSGKLRLFAHLRSCLENASRHRPLLAVIEDLQWADAGTVDFLAYLLERAGDMRLAVLLTSRLAGRSRHASYLERLSRHCSSTLRLISLSMSETTRLVKSLLNTSDASHDVAKWVYAETEGHPLFVVETLRLLHRQGNLGTPGGKLSTGHDRLFSGRSDSIPDGVRLAVEQRLALIEADVLRIAQIASVLGRGFDAELLGVVVGARRNRLSRAIDDLLREGIFEREGAGYRFTHDKIRAVCYGSLPLRSRRAFHGRAAAALVQAPDIPVHQLAWHQSSAAQWNLAAASWEQAGDHARCVHAYEEALRAYSHAISCTWKDATTTEEREGREAELLVKSDEVLEALGRPTDRRDILKRLGVLSQRGTRESLRATWLIRRALLEEHVANFQAAGTLARRAWRIASVAGDTSAEFEAMRVLARTLYQSGRFQRSLAISRLGLRKVAGQRSRAIVTALWQAASTCYLTGDYALAASFLERGMRISTELGLEEESHYVMFGRAILEKFAGKMQASRACLLRMMQFAKQHGDALMIARASPHLCSVDAYEGRLGDALRSLRTGILASRSTGHFRTHVSCLNEVANGVGRLLGNFRWAWNASKHALNLSGAADKLLIRAMCRDSQAALLQDEGRIDEAAVVIDEVLRLQEQGRGSFGPAQEYIARRGAIRLELGNLTGAIADLEQAKSVQVQVGVRSAVVDTLTYLSMAYAKLDYADRAVETSEEALRLLSELDYANMQPQRIFWHHYRILEMFGREPRLPYLKRAVEFIEAQAATLSKAQARRFKRDVRLNREILEAWERQQGLDLAAGETAALRRSSAHPLAAAPPTEPAYAPIVLSA